MDDPSLKAAAALVVALTIAPPPVADEKHLHPHEEPKEDQAAMRGARLTLSVATTTVIREMTVITGPPKPPGTPAP